MAWCSVKEAQGQLYLHLYLYLRVIALQCEDFCQFEYRSPFLPPVHTKCIFLQAETFIRHTVSARFMPVIIFTKYEHAVKRLKNS